MLELSPSLYVIPSVVNGIDMPVFVREKGKIDICIRWFACDASDIEEDAFCGIVLRRNVPRFLSKMTRSFFPAAKFEVEWKKLVILVFVELVNQR